MHPIPPGMLRSGAVPKRKAKPAPAYAEQPAVRGHPETIA
jgi:hypothetical protein